MKAALFFAAVLAAAILGQNHADARVRETRGRPVGVVKSESHVPQIPANLRERPGAPPPEILAQPKNDKKQAAQNGGSSAPVTCTSANANSPSCYTATQQSHPVGK